MTFQIHIDNMAHEGQGVGRIKGLTVFVEEALPGEDCIVEIVKRKRNYAIAKIVEILKPSPDRVKPPCPWADRCGGCMLLHLDYKGQLQFKTQKVKDSLQRIGHLDTKVFDTVGMDNPWYYRNKAQYPVEKKNGDIVFGFYEKRSHNLVDIDNCMIQHDLNNKGIQVIKEWMKAYQVTPYDEIKHQGLIRHGVIRVGRKTGDVMVILVANGKTLPYTDKLIDMLTKKIPNLKSVVLNINTKKTNVIMGKENITLYGSSYIYDYIGDVKFRLSPLSFFQVNPIQVEILYKKALEFAGLTGKETVIDLYCGIGTISLFLAKHAKKVYGIEVVPQAVTDAKTNAEINDIKNAEFIEGAAEKILPNLAQKGIKTDVIVVDPPRRGCDEKTLEAIAEIKPHRIVYVSCNPATLARDLQYLEEKGYKTEKVQPVDMFPQTSHVECVVLIEKQ